MPSSCLCSVVAPPTTNHQQGHPSPVERRRYEGGLLVGDSAPTLQGHPSPVERRRYEGGLLVGDSAPTLQGRTSSTLQIPIAHKRSGLAGVRAGQTTQ
jgi:hypothetical protein